MKDLIAGEVGGPSCIRPGADHFASFAIRPGSLTATSGNSCQLVALIAGFQSPQDVGSATGSASENVRVSPRANVHQNVHQRIRKDRVGYVWISKDSALK
jgi:hypothetical protein